jgi:WhiB family redox-sensing transcriptional regulator
MRSDHWLDLRKATKAGPNAHSVTDFLGSLVREPWMAEAQCAEADPDSWFPNRGGHRANNLMAIRICHQCPVRQQCLEYAKTHHLLGIWGGTTEQQRTRSSHHHDRSTA